MRLIPNNQKGAKIMADNNQQASRMGPIKRLASLIQGNTDDLYKNTYYSDPSNKQQLQALKKDITSTIKDIMSNNSDVAGETNISKLYERLLLSAQNDPDLVKGFESIFGDIFLIILVNKIKP